jgi:chromate reductase
MAILMISGSLRRESHNAALLRAAAALLPATAEVRRYGGLGELPAYNEDHDGELVPQSVQRLRGAIAAAGAVLIATPEYNGSIPGALKNALDWASRPFPDNAWRDKPVAVIGASTGIFGAAWAQAELRKSLGLAGACVLEAELAVGQADTAFAPSGALSDPDHHDGLRAVVDVLTATQTHPLAIGAAAVPEPQGA